MKAVRLKLDQMLPTLRHIRLSLLLLPLLNAGGLCKPYPSILQNRQTDASPHLAVLGDSWGSGVAYSPSSAYDWNKDFCLRYSEAYGAQLEKDKTWTATGSNTMQFRACSGSKLVHLAKADDADTQLNKLTGPLDAIIITSGGNDAQFFAVVDSCVFHSDITMDYGPEFPDVNGKCQQAIDLANAYITGSRPGHRLKHDLELTYRDFLVNNNVQNNEGVKIYHTGYAQFFEIRTDGDDDWCTKTKASFNIPFGKTGSTLSKDLRTAINNLVLAGNKVIESVTQEDEFKDKFGFIDIDGAFQDHRFCEKGSNKADQYYSKDVWLWNVVAPGFGAVAVEPGIKPQGIDSDPDFESATDGLVIDDDFIKNGGVRLFSGGDGSSDPSNGNSLVRGWMLRPMHPKGPGYTGIKDRITSRLKADKVAGTVKITSDMCSVCTEDGCPDGYDCCANGTCPPS